DRGELFRKALTAIRLAKFGEAKYLLEKSLEEEAGSDWSPNVLFWLGLMNERLARYETALGIFHECASLYPKHRYAPLALMHQVENFLKLRDKPSAKLALKKIIKEYPGSVYAKRAKKRLAELGK
ncbi:MAG: hypothetical protein D6808_04565, partial [Candidatus Dadabacteria bacterium]